MLPQELLSDAGITTCMRRPFLGKTDSYHSWHINWATMTHYLQWVCPFIPAFLGCNKFNFNTSCRYSQQGCTLSQIKSSKQKTRVSYYWHVWLWNSHQNPLRFKPKCCWDKGLQDHSSFFSRWLLWKISNLPKRWRNSTRNSSTSSTLILQLLTFSHTYFNYTFSSPYHLEVCVWTTLPLSTLRCIS